MNRRLPLILILALGALVPLHAGDGKRKHSIAIHSEGSPADGEKRVFPRNVLGEERFFRISPEITETNFKAFYPFKADDGTSFGATFFLDDKAALRLDQLTTADQGKFVLAVVDGQPVDYMTIDKPVTDGVITIWRGLSQEHLEFMEKKLKVPAVRVSTDLPATVVNPKKPR